MVVPPRLALETPADAGVLDAPALTSVPVETRPDDPPVPLLVEVLLLEEELLDEVDAAVLDVEAMPERI